MVIPSISGWLLEGEMGREGLFEGLPESVAPREKASGKPRLREPVRDQIELRPVDIDSLIGALAGDPRNAVNR